MTEFTKADLKYGYLVVLRNGDKAIYMPAVKEDFFDYMDGVSCLSLDFYRDDLTFKDGNDNFISSNFDVVKVYGFTSCGYKTTAKNIDERKLIYHRPNIKEMTMEELERHFGCKIKIIKKTN